MADAQANQRIWLLSSDGVTIELGESPCIVPPQTATNPDMLPDRAVAERSMLIKNLLDDLGSDSITATSPIPIQNVSSASLPHAPPPSRQTVC